jgi:hypothetical protein
MGAGRRCDDLTPPPERPCHHDRAFSLCPCAYHIAGLYACTVPVVAGVTAAGTITRDIRGRERLALVHALAANDQTQDQLAERFGRHEQAIAQFSVRNRAEIAEARRAMAGEFSGLWIARKEARLAEYQQKYDDIDVTLSEHDETVRALLAGCEDKGERRRLFSSLLSHADVNRYVLTQLRILASTAEEMGHLPSRTPGEGPAQVQLRHEVVGVDLAAAMFDPRLDPVGAP